MSMQRLRPFATPPLVTVRGGVERRPAGIFLQYLLVGDLAGLSLPVAKGAPARRDRLWESTCLECFFGWPDRPGYWEVNLSPNGDWNVYAFADYRQGMCEEAAVAALTVDVARDGDTLALSVLLPTAGLVAEDDSLRIGLCAVLQERAGRESYWALAHPADQPDFHDRRGFGLAL